MRLFSRMAGTSEDCRFGKHDGWTAPGEEYTALLGGPPWREPVRSENGRDERGPHHFREGAEASRVSRLSAKWSEQPIAETCNATDAVGNRPVRDAASTPREVNTKRSGPTA